MNRIKHYIKNRKYYLSIAPIWVQSRRRQNQAFKLIRTKDVFQEFLDSREAVAVFIFGNPQQIKPALLGHYKSIGIEKFVLLFADPECELADAESVLSGLGFDLDQTTIIIRPSSVARHDLLSAILNGPLKGRWAALIFGNEYLFFPHCGSRSLSDFCEFLQGERRASAFGIELDLYRDRFVQNDDCDPFHQEWFFDGLGYAQKPLDELYSVGFYGGLTSRAGKRIGNAGDQLRSRTVLFKSSGDLELRPESRFAVRRRYNAAISDWHASPTLCLVSTTAFEQLCGRQNRVPQEILDDPKGWLRSEHSISFEPKPEVFIRNGLMNPGQWF